jgi:hypothetical protein
MTVTYSVRLREPGVWRRSRPEGHGDRGVLYIFARRRGHSAEDAQNLIQAFSCTYWNTGHLRALTGSKVNFGRSYSPLSRTTSLIRFDRPPPPEKRGDKEFVRLDAEEAEERYRLEPVEFLTAEKIFDARSAMTVLGDEIDEEIHARCVALVASKCLSTALPSSAFWDFLSTSPLERLRRTAGPLKRRTDAPVRAGAASFLERRSSVRSACCARLLPEGVESGESSASEEAVKSAAAGQRNGISIRMR